MLCPTAPGGRWGYLFEMLGFRVFLFGGEGGYKILKVIEYMCVVEKQHWMLEEYLNIYSTFLKEGPFAGRAGIPEPPPPPYLCIKAPG